MTQKDLGSIFDCIVYIKRDRNAMTLTDQNFVNSCGKARNHRSTKGQQLCCKWKDGSTSWEKLYGFKNCYPVKTSEYDIAHGIEHEP